LDFFLIFLFLLFRGRTRKRFLVKFRLGCNLQDFNFFDLESRRTRENDLPVQPGVVGVRVAKLSGAGICVAAIVNPNVNSATKTWTKFGITTDRPFLRFSFQRKSPCRDVVRILHREKKLFRLLSALKRLSSSPYFPLCTRDSHSTGLKPPKMFPFVSKITVRVFA
jgi:hypothetical protein